MLRGIGESPIIAGAYVSDEGICPLLAAHRRGPRDEAGEFAEAWDRFTGVYRARLARSDELAVLRSLLEHSLGAARALEAQRIAAAAKLPLPALGRLPVPAAKPKAAPIAA
jgi:hypothetical protein